jgi:hypothetical protein
MAKFEAVEVEEAPFARRWTIMEIVPGEKPIPVPFFGRKTDAQAEARRLTLFGGRPTAATNSGRKRKK